MDGKNILIIILLIFARVEAYAFEVIGKPQIIDGDTIKIELKIRLEGIDAPEIKQKCIKDNQNWECGQVSKQMLEHLISNQKVRCELDGKDKYKRLLGTCFVNDININSWMVENGWATSYFVKDYTDSENIAKSEKKGIWASEFIQPSKYRKLKKATNQETNNSQVTNTTK